MFIKEEEVRLSAGIGLARSKVCGVQLAEDIYRIALADLSLPPASPAYVRVLISHAFTLLHEKVTHILFLSWR
ncbi:hypothetical protein J6590_022971 [Homalodisca vitripennis]|nr:hypothetical protein J6590_022971 [Homalodisca vitripennis]